MFWLGLVIALLSGLPQIEFFRDAFKRRFHWVRNHHLDYIALLLLVSGLCVSAVDHILSERQAEKERIARVRIEQQLTPRSLSEKQQQNVADKIRRFSPQSFEFIFYPEDKEVVGLVKMIAQPLLAAGWQGVKPTSWLGFALVTGVNIEYPEDQLEAAAIALAAALQEQGIAASASLNKKYNENTSRIRIRVGKKP